MAESGKLLYPSITVEQIDARIATVIQNNFLDDVELSLLERLKVIVANGQITQFIDFNDIGSVINYNSDLTFYLGGDLITPSEFTNLNNCVLENQSVTRKISGTYQSFIPFVDYNKYNIEFLSIGKNNTIWSNINVLFFNFWEPYYEGYKELGFDIVKLENSDVIFKSSDNYPLKVGNLRTFSDGGSYNSNGFKVYSSNDSINWTLEYISALDDNQPRVHAMDFTAKYVKLTSLGNLLVPKDGNQWWDIKIGGEVSINKYSQTYDFSTRDHTIDGNFPWNTYQFRTEATLAKLDNLNIESPQIITTTTQLAKGAEVYLTDGSLGYVNSSTDSGNLINDDKVYTTVIHGSELKTFETEVEDREIIRITASSIYNNSFNPENLRTTANCCMWRSNTLIDRGLSNTDDNVWVMFELANPIELRSYTIKFDDQRKLPSSWKVMASYNGIDWNLVDLVDNYIATPGILESFVLPSRLSKYKFYKIVFLKDSYSNTCTVCSTEPNLTLVYLGLVKTEQVSLFGRPSQTLFLQSGEYQKSMEELSRKIYLPHKLKVLNLFTGGSALGYVPENMLTNDDKTWKPKYSADRWFTIELEEKAPLYEIVFHSNDSKYNVYYNVEILGSNDNSTWNSLKIVTVASESEKITISNISKLVEYKFYKVKCLDKLFELRYVEYWNTNKENAPVIVTSYKKEDFLSDNYKLKYFNSSSSSIKKIEGVLTKADKTLEELNTSNPTQ